MNKAGYMPKLRRDQRGTSLLEVLISVLIMAVGLLGIAAMQATALRNSQGSTERSQAVIQNYAIIDAMRANRDQALAGAYNWGEGIWTCTVPAGGTLVNNDRARWLTALKTTLLTAPHHTPVQIAAAVAADTSVCGSINCTATDTDGDPATPSQVVCAVGVRWDESRSGSTGGEQAGDVEQVIQTRVQI